MELQYVCVGVEAFPIIHTSSVQRAMPYKSPDGQHEVNLMSEFSAMFRPRFRA